MANESSLVIRNGTLVDGTGGEPFETDIAIVDGLITQVGQVTGRANEEIDARAMLVTPGFVDIHPHYDGRLPGATSSLRRRYSASRPC